MRKAKHTRPVSISLSPEVYESIKKITDKEEISIAEWFRKLTEDALLRLSKQTPEKDSNP